MMSVIYWVCLNHICLEPVTCHIYDLHNIQSDKNGHSMLAIVSTVDMQLNEFIVMNIVSALGLQKLQIQVFVAI